MSERLVSLKELKWEPSIAVPTYYQQRSSHIPETHERAMTLAQFLQLGSFIQEVLQTVEIIDPHPQYSVGQITWENINLYHLNDLFVMRLTHHGGGDASCSFVELVASGPQPPVWFVSHWWGTYFKMTIQMLCWHAQVRGLAHDSAYWMCTFANNQHQLGELNEPDLLATPFVRAILQPTCVGTVVFLDEKATPFQRAWCVLEAYITQTVAKNEGRHYVMDIEAVIEDRQIRDGKVIENSAVLLKDDGDGTLVDVCEQQGGRFPYEVSEAAMETSIQDAAATNPKDKDNILRLIVGAKSLDEPIPESHPNFDQVNQTLHRIFGPRALFANALHGKTEVVKQILDGGLSSPDAQTEDGTTALHVAAQHEHLDIMKLLLDSRADPQPLNANRASPAFRAAQKNKVKSMEMLIQHGVDINVGNHKGNAPIHMAAANTSLEVLQVLLEQKADVNQKTKAGETALSRAVQAREGAKHRARAEAVIELLKEAGAQQ